MRSSTGTVLTAAFLTLPLLAVGQPAPEAPHSDPQTGVLLEITDPLTRGECAQCHPEHGGETLAEAEAPVLFTENTNAVPFWTQGAEPCHPLRPTNYPLDESDRMPESHGYAGYFEANVGGVRRVGVQFRGRWPGEQVYSNPSVAPSGHFFSPHAMDPDMPRLDPSGQGSCLNCHDPHEGVGPLDLLTLPYGGITGHASVGPPSGYDLCFSCHGVDGPLGMEPQNRLIADFYDRGINGDTAGHQIRMNPAVALSWPSNVRMGDMLPCYDCHNPHGSEGNNRAEPNAFLVSDQRRGWSGLTDTLDDPVQCRRFCFGCHIPSDGIPGTQTVEGIVMNTISVRQGHDSMSSQSCYECHGNDYAAPTSSNVHNPAPGLGVGNRGFFD